jgi:predicted nucleic acid-binding protein
VIVVKTNIIGYMSLSADRSALAEQALLKDASWSTPLLWRSELRNVLSGYIRKKLLKLDETQQIMEAATQLMQAGEYTVTSDKVLGLAAASTCSAYACEFVALAEDLHIPLVTIDNQILSQFPRRAISLEEFIAG